jgi:hypothetical protein
LTKSNRFTSFLLSVIGIQGHAIDIQNKAIHAVGAFTNGGFEKIVELNSEHPDYVMFSISGYTGNFGGKFLFAKRSSNEFLDPLLRFTHRVPFVKFLNYPS